MKARKAGWEIKRSMENERLTKKDLPQKDHHLNLQVMVSHKEASVSPLSQEYNWRLHLLKEEGRGAPSGESIWTVEEGGNCMVWPNRVSWVSSGNSCLWPVGFRWSYGHKEARTTHLGNRKDLNLEKQCQKGFFQGEAWEGTLWQQNCTGEAKKGSFLRGKKESTAQELLLVVVGQTTQGKLSKAL